jgi:hypothetical protein
MRRIGLLMLFAAVLPATVIAQDGHTKPERLVTGRKAPAPGDFVAPGVLRQDLFDRRNPNNLRHDYPTPPAQPGQF